MKMKEASTMDLLRTGAAPGLKGWRAMWELERRGAFPVNAQHGWIRQKHLCAATRTLGTRMLCAGVNADIDRKNAGKPARVDWRRRVGRLLLTWAGEIYEGRLDETLGMLFKKLPPEVSFQFNEAICKAQVGCVPDFKN